MIFKFIVILFYGIIESCCLFWKWSFFIFGILGFGFLDYCKIGGVYFCYMVFLEFKLLFFGYFLWFMLKSYGIW